MQHNMLPCPPPGDSRHIHLILSQSGCTREVLEWQYPGTGTPQDTHIVDWIGDEFKDPTRFSRARKWTITVLQALAVLGVAFSSTAYSSGVSNIVAEFRVSTTVAMLGVSMFVLGFALGPLLWAPLSELYGRQIIFFVTYAALTAFNAASAAAPNITSLIIIRFLGGLFGSSPLTNAGGVIADMFPASERGLATAIFAMAPFLGPSMGPIAGGFLAQASGWRWVEGLMACLTGVLWIILSISVPETYAPFILRRRAEKLSKLTGRTYISKYDVHGERKSLGQEIRTAIFRPWVLSFKEPIVLFTSFYIAIVYGTLYMLFAAFPIVFQQQRGWSQGVGGLAFLGTAMGVIVGVSFSLYDSKRYVKVVERAGGHAPPEARLPPAIIGSFLLPVGLFWFAWTNGSDIHWIVPIIGSGFFSAGLVQIFLSLMNYIIDTYMVYAASALAANSVLRSLFGAAFPLFTTAMYHNLGIHWASSVPAFLAVACIPCPLILYKYGEKIRANCEYAAESARRIQRAFDEIQLMHG